MEPMALLRASVTEMPLKQSTPGVMREPPLQTLRQSLSEIATILSVVHSARLI